MAIVIFLFVLTFNSRYAFVRLLKNKRAKNVGKKFESMIAESKGIPEKIQCDEGTEFQKIRSELSKKYKFIVLHTYNQEIKASHAERFIQTLKFMIRRTLTTVRELRGTPTYKNVEFLPHIVERYNDEPHRGLFGLAPRQVYKGKRRIDAAKQLRATLKNSKPERDLLKRNDRVRVVRVKANIFEKASLRAWRKEIFLVDKVLIYDPVIYKLKDLKVEPIDGIFYRRELQKLKPKIL